MEFLSGLLFLLAVASISGVSVNFNVPNAKLEPSSVTVVVVEYRPELEIEANAKHYIEIIDLVKNNKPLLDLIAFPEDTLGHGSSKLDSASYVDIGEIPCTSSNGKYPKYISDISCAAASADTYVVINAVEKVKCDDSDTKSENCKLYGHYFYNTDVTFDNTGALVQKYNKYNLFGEYSLDRPSRGEIKTFTVKFKETFGMFTCFDILFQEPAELLVNAGVKNVVFPTMWFSELPFLTALQAQQMWAHAHDVTLFAAGANQPIVGSGGSGIYKGAQGPMSFDINMSNTTSMEYFVYENSQEVDSASFFAIEDADIDALASEMDNFYLKADNLSLYTSTLLESILQDQDNAVTEVCYKDLLCCQFDIKISRSNNDFIKAPLERYTFHLVAYSGIRSFDGVYNGGIEICAVLACLDEDVRSCGQRFGNQAEVGWPITFDSITITADFTYTNATQYPNSLLSSIRPIHPKYTTWSEGVVSGEKGKEVAERKFSLNEPQSRLMTFGIYGRKFSLDFDPLEAAGGGGADLARISILMLIFLVFLDLFAFCW